MVPGVGAFAACMAGIHAVKAGEIVPMPTPAGAARAANGNQRASTNGQQPGQQSGQRDDDVQC